MTANILTAAENSPGYLPGAFEPVSREASRRVSLFRNGANQAVRIPKEFELPGKEATLRRVGNHLVLEALPDKPKKGTPAALLLALDEMAKLGPIDEEFPDVDDGLLPLDDIDFGAD
jgi:antitoxin VapB